MHFIDEEHKNFWEKKYKELEKLEKKDVYYKSLVYILGICKETREHFEEIFNIIEGNININSLQSAWQTGNSEKATRMAFDLWTGCCYDSEKDLDEGKTSTKYNTSEIFNCSFAPYFYEAIKIRYPEYTQEILNENIGFYSIERITKSEECKITGIYIRGNEEGIEQQEKEAKEYCKKHNIKNIVIYKDVGFSGLANNRPAYCKMKEEIETKRIEQIIVTSHSKISRNIVELVEFIEECKDRDVKIISLDEFEVKLNAKGKNKDLEKQEIESSEDEDMEME